MTKLVLLLFAFLSISPCVFSQNDNNQNNSSSEQIPSRFWKATLPGGEYMVALNSISSIAKHTYIVLLEHGSEEEEKISKSLRNKIQPQSHQDLK